MLTKLRRETLAEQASQSLIEFIQTQSLKPGDVLPSEAKLSVDFGVSRPIIREALKSLAGKGVIEIVNGRGAVVKPIDSETLSEFFERAMHENDNTIMELMEVRKGIEVQSAALAAQRRTPEELAKMSGIVSAMRQHLNDPDMYIDLDTSLHLTIASATHNAMMYHLVESMREAIKEFMRTKSIPQVTHEQYSGLERSQSIHESLLSALERGDVNAAREVMSAHFDIALKAMAEQRPEGVFPS
jgi:DNA-binding FadR family transcriptional regulator